MYAWLRRPVPGLRVARGDLLLAQIPVRVESVRAAGQPVRLDVPDGLVLSVAIGLTAYRVVPEALTNALRYARGARTSVGGGFVGHARMPLVQDVAL